MPNSVCLFICLKLFSKEKENDSLPRSKAKERGGIMHQMIMSQNPFLSILDEILLRGNTKRFLLDKDTEFLVSIFEKLSIPYRIPARGIIANFEGGQQISDFSYYVSMIRRTTEVGSFTFSRKGEGEDVKKEILYMTLDYFNVEYTFEYPTVYL